MASSSLLNGNDAQGTRSGFAINDDDEQVESNDENDDPQNGHSNFGDEGGTDQVLDHDDEDGHGVGVNHEGLDDSGGVDMLAGHLPVFPYPLPPHGAFPMMHPQMLHPFFLTPPHFNPYSPSQGAGEYYPPAISQNPYPLPAVPPHMMMDHSMEVPSGMTLDVQASSTFGHPTLVNNVLVLADA